MPEPVQEVSSRVPLAFETHDWRNQPSATQQAQLDAFLRADRRRGFTLTQAPLMRLSVIQLADNDVRCIFTFHHAILDGRSLLLLLKELFAFYEAQRRHEQLNLQQPRPYQDYIAWLDQQNLAASESFWRDLLAGFHAPTVLGVERQDARAVSNVTEPAAQQIWLSEATTAALTTMAEQHQLTVSTLIQGAWALLLSRYSGQDDVVFGVTRSCRRGTVEGAETMIGLFINTLPLRARIAPEQSLLDWLRELRAQNRAIRDHQHTPLMQVQQWSDVGQGQPLFNSIVVFENHVLQDALRAEGDVWAARSFDLVRQPNYPLALGAFGGAQLLCRIIYDQQRYEHATIDRMLGHLQTLLEGMIERPEQRVSELPLLTAAEQQELVAWNTRPAPAPLAGCIPDLVVAQAARTPDAVAVRDATTTLTYAQLVTDATQLAGVLQARGVGPEVVVGVCLPRSTMLVVAQLAVLLAGGAYLPLDPAAPAARAAAILADAQVALLLTTAALQDALALPATIAVLCLDRAVALEPAAGLVPAAAQATQLAYVIATSGSTGRPKGVAVSHANLCNLVAWHQQTYAVTAADRATLLASPAFDAAVWELWPYLAAGAQLVIPDEVTRGEPARLATWLAAEGITLSFVPTALAEALLAEPWPPTHRLRALLVGGDQLHPLAATCPVRVVNHYGPTEVTVVTSAATVEPGVSALPAIGRPIARTQAQVLDGQGQPVPVGVVGELYIGGASVARGYHGQAAQTAARFVPDPWSSAPGGRLYRTGDLVRWGADGQLRFVGRGDGQVKLRGYRIELGEIEAVLAQHHGIDEVVVLAREDAPGDKKLVAYVVAAEQRAENQERVLSGQTESQSLTAAALRDFLRDKLPDYMVPSAFVVLPALPVTSSGKLDRKALPAPTHDRLAEMSSYVAPRTPIEEVLVGIWAQVLGLPHSTARPALGIHDHFFTLGGHSLLVIQAMFRIQEVFQVELPLQSLFHAPTVAEFAQLVEKDKRDGSTPHSPAIVRLDRKRHRAGALQNSSETAPI